MNHQVKYNIKATRKTLAVTLEVPNDEDGRRWMHDVLAIRIAGPSNFIASIFHVEPRQPSEADGVFTPRYKTYTEASK